MKARRLNALLLGIITFSVALGPLARILTPSSATKYWTNSSMKEELAKGKDYFELYLTGEKLEQVLGEGRLFIEKDGQPIKLVEQDISLRINRYQEATRYDLLFVGILLSLSLMSIVYLIATFFVPSKLPPPAPKQDLT